MTGVRGLVSVTFRGMTAEEIVRLSASSGLQGIEWGADVHVPPQDLENASRVGRLTREAGLEVVSYGSYYRAGSGENSCSHSELVAAAEALGARNIRIWAGSCGSAQAGPEGLTRVAEDAFRLAELCEARGMTLSFEYHPNTLTDTRASAVRLMETLDHKAARIYWQPVQSLSAEENLAALRDVLPWLSNVHVFQWDCLPGEAMPDRRPLAEGAETWSRYLDLVRGDVRVHNLLLEFVRDDSPEALRADAKEFLSW